MKGKLIDLHVHTNFSDGCDTVKQVIKQAKNNGVSFLSITEHYNMSSYEKACKLAGDDIEIIPRYRIWNRYVFLRTYSKARMSYISILRITRYIQIIRLV